MSKQAHRNSKERHPGKGLWQVEAKEFPIQVLEKGVPVTKVGIAKLSVYVNKYSRMIEGFHLSAIDHGINSGEMRGASSPDK